jgi:hypothetical protein
MGEPDEREPADSELEKAREKLFQLYKKVRTYAEAPGSEDPAEIKSPPVGKVYLPEEEVPLEEIRNKLSAINHYFREKMAGRPAELPTPLRPVRPKVELPPQEEAPKSEPTIPKEPIPVPKVESPSSKVLPDILKPPASPDTGDHAKQGVGLDLGTSSIIASRESDENRVVSRIERNVFLGVRSDATTKNLLARLNIKYAAVANKLYVLGDMALELSHIFNREGQRPMSIGILNPGEMESLPIIKLLVQNVLWQPRFENEVCCFSVPAKIMDTEADTIYHKGVFERILVELGFKPAVVDEGYAVVLAELADKDFTGIGISCGAGLVNICAAFKSMPVLSFSVPRGGDWIDKNAATALGLVASNVMAIKEQGINLSEPGTREEEAIAIYYRSYIRYFLECMARMFSARGTAPQFTSPVDIVLAGGTSMAAGFLDMVKEEIKMIPPGIPVAHIRRAQEPLLSVSRGCLFHAMTMAYGEKASMVGG